jgi:hypothetical protein
MLRVLTLVLALAAIAPGEEPARTGRRGVALLASAALPGSGQMLLGSAKRGEAVMWLDGAVWALWAGFTWYSGAREHGAMLCALREAGASSTVTDAAYLRALERYDNADEYNEDVRRDARSYYPDDPEAQHAYYEANGYFGTAAWNWSSDSSRLGFWELRRAARSAALRAQFAAGALVLNRLASVVDCAFFCREPGVERRVEFRTSDDGAGIELCYHF